MSHHISSTDTFSSPFDPLLMNNGETANAGESAQSWQHMAAIGANNNLQCGLCGSSIHNHSTDCVRRQETLGSGAGGKRHDTWTYRKPR